MSNVRNILSPICKAKWLWVFAPNTRYGSKYSVTCVMDSSNLPEWKKLQRELLHEYKEFYDTQCSLSRTKLPKSPYLPWKTDKEGEEVFVCSNSSEGTRKDGVKFTCQPEVYGPDGRTLKPEDLNGELGNGTLVRVGFRPNLYVNDAQGVGLTARLMMVQIVKPVFRNALDAFQDVGGKSVQKYEVDPSWFKEPTPAVTPAKNGKPTSHNVDGQEVDDLFAGGEDAGQ